MTLTPQEAILKFSLSDPTRNKSATQWLITTYLQNGFRFEDLMGDQTSKVYETLLMFGLYRKNLSVEMRSLNKYKTLGDLWGAVEQFIPKESEIVSQSGKSLKRAERERVHSETEFIYQDDTGFTIVSPKTQSASCWWGKGTRWCTASENNNMFNHYNNEGPLLIIIMPNRDKLQLHVGSDIQFMDAQDNSVKQQYISDNWDSLSSIMRWAVKQDGRALRFVPKEHRDRELCWEAVKQDGWVLAYVPKEHRNRELSWEAVKQNGLALEYVPSEHQDRELCLEAVKQNGLALEYVPEKYRDRELCWEAVKQNGLALQSVPREHQDRELCLEAVKHNGQVLVFVSKEHINRELCWEAVKQNGHALEYVPSEHINRGLCLEAVKQNGDALQYVPSEHRDKELCLEAVRQDGRDLASVFPEYRNRELCREAVRQNGRALHYVPKEYQDELRLEIDITTPTWPEIYQELKRPVERRRSNIRSNDLIRKLL